MRRPATELLVGRDAAFQHLQVDLREIGCLGAGDFGRRRLVQPEPRLAVGAGEGPRHVGLQPVGPGAQAGKAAAADLPADLRHDMADAVGFELLRERPLLLDIGALAVAEGAVDLGGAAGMDGLEPAVIDTGLVAGIFEHGQRLAAAEQHDLRPFELAPVERRVGFPSGQEKPVHLVDLGEMDDAGILALGQRPEPLAERRLHDMGGAVLQRRDGGDAGRRNRPARLQPLLVQEPAGDGRDQRRIEGREQGELDVDLGHGRRPSRRCAAGAPVLARQDRPVYIRAGRAPTRGRYDFGEDCGIRGPSPRQDRLR